ncbi:hypothetical protein MTR67_011902, partial [Solanum verrucosum]
TISTTKRTFVRESKSQEVPECSNKSGDCTRISCSVSQGSLLNWTMSPTDLNNRNGSRAQSPYISRLEWQLAPLQMSNDHPTRLHHTGAHETHQEHTAATSRHEKPGE